MLKFVMFVSSSIVIGLFMFSNMLSNMVCIRFVCLFSIYYSVVMVRF